MFLFPVFVDAAGNYYTKNKKAYDVKWCQEFDVVSAADGTVTTATDAFSAFGVLWIYVLPDDAGDLVYSGDHAPTSGTLYLKNAAGQTITSIAITYTDELNGLVLNADGVPIYLVDGSTGEPAPRTGLYFTGTGFGATKKLKIGICYDIQ